MKKLTIAVLSVLTGCGAPIDSKGLSGDTNNATNNGATNNGATNNGATNNDATNNGATNSTATNNNASTNAGTTEGAGFPSGNYFFFTRIEDPLPAVLKLSADVRVADDGTVAMAGADLDEIEGADKLTLEPAELFVDESEQGFVAHATGRSNGTGVELDAFDMTVPAGPFVFSFVGPRFSWDTPDLQAYVHEGLLTFESVRMVEVDTGETTEYPAGEAELLVVRVEPDPVPAGTPDVCSDPCGGVVVGYCEVPEDFPPPAVCPD